MIGRLALTLALALPCGVSAPDIRDTPRALDIFADVSGYADLIQRSGTPASPAPSEMGLVLVSRMFRSVCLGIENGASLNEVMPEGFSVHTSASWLMGETTPRTGGPIVLSSTGDIGLDEDNGHPSIELSPSPNGMTCQINWRIPGEVNDGSRAAIASLLWRWLPWEYALVDAMRPELSMDLSQTLVNDWDRPCGTRWCAMDLLYLPDGQDIHISTTLNITDIEGPRP